MRREEWVVLVAALSEGAPLTPVQLQKSLFLVRELVPSAQKEQVFYEFEPYNYGPFCADIYHDADRMELQGLMEIDLSGAGRWREYCATPAGQDRGTELAQQLPSKDVDYIRDLVKWVKSLSFNQLLGSIYRQWPQYKANSLFTG